MRRRPATRPQRVAAGPRRGTAGPRRVASARVVALAAAAVAVAAGCLPTPASTEGRSIADLYGIFIAGGVVVAGIVWVLATWALIRYRRRNDELPTQTAGSIPIEAIWTATPLVTVLVLFVLTLGTLNVVDATDPSAVQLNVTAFRWGWQVSYPSNGRTVSSVTGQAATIVVPTDRRIQVNLSSADVNHAFFVPAFLFKKDAIPGRPTSFEISVPNAGTYPGACAEYCGIGHDAMPFTIVAVSGSAFDAWLATGQLPGDRATPAASPP